MVSCESKRISESSVKEKPGVWGKACTHYKDSKSDQWSIAGSKAAKRIPYREFGNCCVSAVWGAKNTAAMVREFFRKAPELVLRPIKDRTGQSVHVDDYLGPGESSQRQTASRTLARIDRRLQAASASRDVEGWRDLVEGVG